MQNRELNDTKQKLSEANSLVAVYKARIEHMAKELMVKHNAQKSAKEGGGGGGAESDKAQPPTSLNLLAAEDMFYSPRQSRQASPQTPKQPGGASTLTSTPSSEVSGAQHLEDKFLVLKERMKRIEKELYLKSKELEKANESRSKVAKYTRSLLQELESRLSETQQKLTETDDKLKNASTELKMERERRLQLEEGPRRRMSSVASPPKSETLLKDAASAAVAATSLVDHNDSQESLASEFTEHDADTKYADYYRSRFKEAEEALLEKDMKLHQAEQKIKEIQTSMKSTSDSYKVINELQTKLADATHKLSDRQLKIHQLTREIDRLKGYEKTYEKKVQHCNTLEEMVKDLENTTAEQSKSLHATKQEVEILKIREVVLKEQLQTLLEEEGSEDEDEYDNMVQLHKSIALKNQISNMVELEAQAKKLTLDNENLCRKNVELELRLRNANIQHFKALENGKNNLSDIDEDTEGYQNRIKELESKMAGAEDRHCHEMSTMKDKHYKEIGALEKQFKEQTSGINELVATLKAEKERMTADTEGECNELRGSITMLNLKVGGLEEKLKLESTAHEGAKSLLVERNSLNRELENRCRLLAAECDILKKNGGDDEVCIMYVDNFTVVDLY